MIIIRTALEKVSMLVDYFALNQRNPEARKFTYGEILSHYIFKKQRGENTSKWEIRNAQFNVIERICIQLVQVK